MWDCVLRDVLEAVLWLDDFFGFLNFFSLLLDFFEQLRVLDECLGKSSLADNSAIGAEMDNVLSYGSAERNIVSLMVMVRNPTSAI